MQLDVYYILLVLGKKLEKKSHQNSQRQLTLTILHFLSFHSGLVEFSAVAAVSWNTLVILTVPVGKE